VASPGIAGRATRGYPATPIHGAGSDHHHAASRRLRCAHDDESAPTSTVLMAERDELLACLDHQLDAAGNPSLIQSVPRYDAPRKRRRLRPPLVPCLDDDRFMDTDAALPGSLLDDPSVSGPPSLRLDL